MCHTRRGNIYPWLCGHLLIGDLWCSRLRILCADLYLVPRVNKSRHILTARVSYLLCNNIRQPLALSYATCPRSRIFDFLEIKKKKLYFGCYPQMGPNSWQIPCRKVIERSAGSTSDKKSVESDLKVVSKSAKSITHGTDRGDKKSKSPMVLILGGGMALW